MKEICFFFAGKFMFVGEVVSEKNKIFRWQSGFQINFFLNGAIHLTLLQLLKEKNELLTCKHSIVFNTLQCHIHKKC